MAAASPELPYCPRCECFPGPGVCNELSEKTTVPMDIMGRTVYMYRCGFSKAHAHHMRTMISGFSRDPATGVVTCDSCGCEGGTTGNFLCAYICPNRHQLDAAAGKAGVRGCIYSAPH